MRPLPDSYAVRLIDLPASIGEQIREYPDGHIDIFVNARWSDSARRDAVEHALEHWANDDFHSQDDIRTVEARADHREPAPRRKRQPIRRDMSGEKLASPPPVFDLFDLERVGRGLYMPTGRNLSRAVADIAIIRAQLFEAAQIYDVMQHPPLLNLSEIHAAIDPLDASCIDFVGWTPRDATTPGSCALMHLSMEPSEASVYYAAAGAMASAHVRLEVCQDDRRFRLLVTIGQHRGLYRVISILRAIDGGEYEMIYGGGF